MTTQFYYTRDTERGTESLVVSGQVVRTIPSSHPAFIRIRDYLFEKDRNGEEIDFEYVLSLSDAQTFINDQLLRVTDRVSFKGGKLLWDGEPTEGALADHIVRMIKARDDNYVAFARFLEKLDQNPSEASRAALFEWIADRDFTITEDGDFIGYKGVNQDYTSIHSGYGIVNGVEMTGQLPNDPGNVVEVPRNKVDANRFSTCSYGLHVGTSSYANTYGSRRIIVSVNPRDVVMVPNDANGQKMRVCRYVVLEDNDDKPLVTTTYRGSHRSDEEEVPTLDRCEECDCLLEDGSCPCPGCNDEADAEVNICTECGDETTTGYSLCDDCEEDQSEEDQSADPDESSCIDCGDPVNVGENHCGWCSEYCDECDESPCECIDDPADEDDEDDVQVGEGGNITFDLDVCTFCGKPRSECQAYTRLWRR